MGKGGRPQPTHTRAGSQDERIKEGLVSWASDLQAGLDDVVGKAVDQVDKARDLPHFFLAAAEKVMNPNKYKRLAAAVLQARTRGLAARRRCSRERAARLVQSVVRQIVARRRLITTIHAVVSIQTAVRGRAARQYAQKLVTSPSPLPRTTAKTTMPAPGSPTSVTHAGPAGQATFEQEVVYADEHSGPAPAERGIGTMALVAAFCTAAVLLFACLILGATESPPLTPELTASSELAPHQHLAKYLKSDLVPITKARIRSPGLRPAVVPFAVVAVTFAKSAAATTLAPPAPAAAIAVTAASRLPVGQLVGGAVALVGAAARLHPIGRAVAPAAQLAGAKLGTKALPAVRLGLRFAERLWHGAIRPLAGTVATAANPTQGLLGGGLGAVLAVLLSA